MNDKGLTALLDEFEICKLSHRYAMALDKGDLEEWGELFAEDVIVESPSAAPRGYAEIMKIPVDQLNRYKRTLHSVTTQNITVNGDEATGEVYCVAYHIYQDAHQNGRLPFDLSHNFIIRYEDEYRRVEGRWLIVKRYIVTEARYIDQIIPPS
ncbi:nuclear transport factor 2 family protein [Microvirga pudoricolor]|jgi:ketosteroid isomerase-like protein|uniref:nuclear transport factor 2 family protein n=1 Tax=Microvirga pudoricolor TaxID=2778729 RepID=UPI00194F85F7|nr:nuclear transport factor 2 family protein [Microvirga pudoricolor]MBM6596707.1 nuclear transport factor 2 family protein [Microvirga pudoricolor]